MNIEKNNLRRKIRKINYICSSIKWLFRSSYLNLIINLALVFIINFLLFIFIFNQTGVLANIELAVKVSLFSLVLSITSSYISMYYFRYKDIKRDIFKDKISVYNELLPMLIKNDEIFSNSFPCAYDINVSYNIPSRPSYKTWNDIKLSYKYFSVESIIRIDLDKIINNCEKFNNLYKIAEKEIYNEITKYLETIDNNASIFVNIADSLLSSIVIHEDSSIRVFNKNSFMSEYNIKYDKNIIFKIVYGTNNFLTLLNYYEIIKECNKSILKYIKGEIDSYYN